MSVEILSWDDILKLEPRLGFIMDTINLINQSEYEHDSPSFCANRVWHLDLKPQLVHLVGWERRPYHDVLSTSEVYEIAYFKLWHALPNCRGCACMGEE